MKSIIEYINESLENNDIQKIIKKLESLGYEKSDDEREIGSPAGNLFYMIKGNSIVYTKGDGNYIFKIDNDNKEYSLTKIDNNGTETKLYSENNLNKFIQKLS